MKTATIIVLCFSLGAAQGQLPVEQPGRKPLQREARPAAAADFVVFGDPQQMPVADRILPGGAPVRAAVRRKIRALAPGLVILAGDAVGAGFYPRFWEQFRREYAGMKIWPVPGNHDLYGRNPKVLSEYFATFPQVKHRRWYELRRPPLVFLMLDSNFREMTLDEHEAQLAWLEERLAAADRDPQVRAVFLVVHHPPFSAHMSGGRVGVRRAFWDRAARYAKFAGSFSGHHHDYQHITVGRRHVFVTGGGGAPLYFLRGDSLPEGAVLEKVRVAHHLLAGRIEKDGVQITMHELDPASGWRIGDRVFIRWPGGRGLQVRLRAAERSLEVPPGADRWLDGERVAAFVWPAGPKARVEARSGGRRWAFHRRGKDSALRLVVTPELRKVWRGTGLLEVADGDRGVVRLRWRPARLDLGEEGARFSIVQRRTASLPGSRGYLEVALGDITAGHVRFVLRTATGRLLVPARFVRAGDEISFAYGGAFYRIRVERLVNFLIGNDYADLQVAPAGGG